MVAFCSSMQHLATVHISQRDRRMQHTPLLGECRLNKQGVITNEIPNLQSGLTCTAIGTIDHRLDR